MFHAYFNKVGDVWYSVVVEDGVLKASNFSLKSREDAVEKAYEHVGRGDVKLEEKISPEVAPILQALSSLYGGEEAGLTVKLAMDDLPTFTRKTMEAVRSIPRGRVATYRGVAEALGRPLAARAVGNVMARNPFWLVVPCHRVVKSDLTVGEYGAGSDVKIKLLEREGVNLRHDGEKDKYSVDEGCLHKFS